MVTKFLPILVLLPLACADSKTGDDTADSEAGRSSVVIVSPAEGAVYALGDAVYLAVEATESDGTETTLGEVAWTVIDTDWAALGNAITVTDLPEGDLELQVSVALDERVVETSVDLSVISPESECDDGLDNDQDGLTDCDDEDCAEVGSCAWPTAVFHQGNFFYDPSTVAEWNGFEECTVAFEGSLARITGSEACPSCDRTFQGSVSYTQNDCPGEQGDYPDELSYGLVFTSDTQWEVYSSDGQTWGSAGTAFLSGTTYTLSRTDEVVVEGIDGGDLTTTLSYTAQ